MAEAFETLCRWSCSWQGMLVGYISKAYHPASVPDLLNIDTRTKSWIEPLRVGAPAGFF
jgi:hypothetical protein